MTGSRKLGIGFEELKKKTFYRDIVIEFIATGCLVFAIGMMVGDLSIRSKYNDMHVALGTGFMVTTIVWGFGSTSGGLIDPAISISCFLMGHIKFVRCVVYVACQCFGGYMGVYIARSLGPEMSDSNKLKFTMTLLNKSLQPWQGIVIEMIGTGVKSLAVFATLDTNRGDLKGSGPLAIGISCMVALMFSVPYTGCSINPARSFGPALLSGNWENHWIYWVGPISGAIIGAVIYEYFCKSHKYENQTSDQKELDDIKKKTIRGSAISPNNDVNITVANDCRL